MKKEEALKKISVWSFDQTEKSFRPIPIRLSKEIDMPLVRELSSNVGSSYTYHKENAIGDAHIVVECATKALAIELVNLGCELLDVPVGVRYVNF